MRGRRTAASAGALALTAGALGLLPLPSAAASCVGPQLTVGTRLDASNPQQGPVLLGDQAAVSGEWFHEGCADSGSAGCLGPRPHEEETPMRHVDLELDQDGRTWALGTGDAASADQDYRIRWDVGLPPGVADGPAVLRADTAEIDVVVDR